MTKRMKIMIIALVIVFGGLLGWNLLRNYFIKQFFATFQPPPATISAVQALAKTWQPYFSSVGTLAAVNGVSISNEATGTITQIYFQSGQMVKKGDLLLKLDDNVEQADLLNNQAILKLSSINLERLNELYKQKAAAKSAVDEAQAKFTQAQAAVMRTTAIIDQKNIKAPFDGKIGIRQVNVGQYLSAGTNLVSLQALDPLYVNFSLPEQNLKSLYPGQTIELTVENYPNMVFKGQINAINSESDLSTHNVLIQASLPNKDNKLYPGLFGNIKIYLPQQNNVITVPQTAVDYSLFGDSIFVVEQDGKDKDGKPILKVNRVYVTTGDHQGSEVAIVKGIKPGTLVVTSGQLKLDNGTRVVIDNSVTL